MPHPFLVNILLLSIPLTNASAYPHQASITSSTATFTQSAAATTACPISCRRKPVKISSISWSSLSVTATITAETVILVVNGQTNSTRTTTVTNTEIDLKNYTPVTDLNSAGTRTTAFTVTSDNTVATHTVAYPTIYHQDYPSSYTICGTLPTIISGVASCIESPCHTNEADQLIWDNRNPSFTFASHPPLAWSTQAIVDASLDPKGWAHEPVWDWGDDYQDQVQPLFADIALWECVLGVLLQPATLKETALYLTATSITTDSGELSGPFASKPSEAETTLPETSSSSTPKPTATLQATSTRMGLGSNQVPSNQPANTLSGLANDDAPLSAVATTGPTDIFGIQSPSPLLAKLSSFTLAPLENLGQPVTTTTSITAQDSPGATTTPTEKSAPEHEGALIVLNSHTLSLDANSQWLVSGQSLIAGSTVAVGSGDTATPIALHTSSSRTILIVGSSTSTLLPGPTPAVAAGPTQTQGGRKLATNSEGRSVVGSQTLNPGSPIRHSSEIAATPIALQTTSSNAVFIIGPSTSTLIRAAAARSQPFTIGSQVLSAISQDQYILGSQTLAPGSPITLGSGVNAIAVQLQNPGSQTVLSTGSITSALAAETTALQPFTIGEQLVTANVKSQYVVDSQILTAGGAITVSGTPVSLAPNGSQVVVGTSTEGLGDHILSGFGPTPSDIASSTPPPTGDARPTSPTVMLSVVLLVGVAAVAIW